MPLRLLLPLALILSCREREPVCAAWTDGGADCGSRRYRSCTVEGGDPFFELSDDGVTGNGNTVPCGADGCDGNDLVLATSWCEGGGSGDADTDADTDSDTDADADADSDADSDTDTDTGEDFCAKELPAPVADPNLGECIFMEVACGDEIEGTNLGGVTHFNKEHYSDWFCASTESTSAHFDGPEAVYLFVLPPETRATVTLDAGCERNLAMRLVRRGANESCMDPGNIVGGCDRDANGTTTQDVQILSVNNELYYEIIVDGRNDVTGNFKLTIDCES